MKYLCLIYVDEKAMFERPPGELDAIAGECVHYDEKLKSLGQFIACERLRPVSTAATVRLRAGSVSVTDGPFAETKEQLAGFYLIEAKDQEGRSGWRRGFRRRGWAALKFDPCGRTKKGPREQHSPTACSHLCLSAVVARHRSA